VYPTRHLKIVKSFSSNPTAFLPLKGRWLERAGFNIGMRVQIVVRKQCLIVLPDNTVDSGPGGVNTQKSRSDGDT
jgi:hypothetical protein